MTWDRGTSGGRHHLDGTRHDEEPVDPTVTKQLSAPQSYWNEKLPLVPGESLSGKVRFLIDDYLERYGLWP